MPQRRHHPPLPSSCCSALLPDELAARIGRELRLLAGPPPATKLSLQQCVSKAAGAATDGPPDWAAQLVEREQGAALGQWQPTEVCGAYCSRGCCRESQLQKWYSCSSCCGAYRHPTRIIEGLPIAPCCWLALLPLPLSLPPRRRTCAAPAAAPPACCCPCAPTPAHGTTCFLLPWSAGHGAAAGCGCARGGGWMKRIR